MSAELLYAVEQADELARGELGGAGGMNSFALILKDAGGILSTYSKMNTNCYASLYCDVQMNTPQYLISYFQKGHNRGYKSWNKTAEVQQEFIEYIIQRSPYKDAFLIKDVDYVLKHGLLCSVDVPSNLLVGGLTAIRTLWEYTYIPLRWKELVALGVQEDIAFIASHCITKSGGKYTFEEESTNHKVFSINSMTSDAVKNFLKRDMVRALDSFKKSGAFERVQEAYGISGDGFFKGYTPKTKEAVEEWGCKKTYLQDTSLSPFADWLKEQYGILMGIKKPTPKKKAAKKGAEHPLIGLISVANGFTLAEVREIRKNLREIIARGLNRNAVGYEGWRSPHACSIMTCIEWSATPQVNLLRGGYTYWNWVYAKLQAAGVPQ